MILETACVIVQLENSASLLWLDQTIQLQLFLILVTIPLNPLKCTFYKKLSVSPAKYGNLLLYLRCFYFFSIKFIWERHGHCDRKRCSSFGRFSYLTKSLNSICMHYLLEVEEWLVRILFHASSNIRNLCVEDCPWTNKGTRRRSFFRGKGSRYRHCTIYLQTFVY